MVLARRARSSRRRRARARAWMRARRRGENCAHLTVLGREAAPDAVGSREGDGAEGEGEEEVAQESDREPHVLVEDVLLVRRLLRRVAEPDAAPPRPHREAGGIVPILRRQRRPRTLRCDLAKWQGGGVPSWPTSDRLPRSLPRRASSRSSERAQRGRPVGVRKWSSSQPRACKKKVCSRK